MKHTWRLEAFSSHRKERSLGLIGLGLVLRFRLRVAELLVRLNQQEPCNHKTRSLRHSTQLEQEQHTRAFEL